MSIISINVHIYVHINTHIYIHVYVYMNNPHILCELWVPQNKNVLGITAILGTKDIWSRVCMCVCLCVGGDMKLVLIEEFCFSWGILEDDRKRWVGDIFFLRGPSTGKSLTHKLAWNNWNITCGWGFQEWKISNGRKRQKLECSYRIRSWMACGSWDRGHVGFFFSLEIQNVLKILNRKACSLIMFRITLKAEQKID